MCVYGEIPGYESKSFESIFVTVVIVRVVVFNISIDDVL